MQYAIVYCIRRIYDTFEKKQTKNRNYNLDPVRRPAPKSREWGWKQHRAEQIWNNNATKRFLGSGCFWAPTGHTYFTVQTVP